MNSFEELVKEIEAKSNITAEKLLELVNKKYSETQNLITKEGALYLVARELGIDIPERRNRTKIKGIVSGTKNINVIGRIFKITKTNEFVKANGEKGRVANIFIGDDTGYVRIPLWDQQVKLLEDGIISLGDVIQVTNTLSRENVFGDVELSLGRFGSINQLEDFVELPSVEELSKMFLNISPERTTIESIVPGGNFEVKGVIVQIFKGNFLFEICSVCGDKLLNKKCIEHGDVATDYDLVLSFILDDSTGDLRCVAFRELAEKLCNISTDELINLDQEKRYKLLSEKILGKELILIGRVKKNKIFDRLELMVNDFKDINPLEESKKLAEELELTIGGVTA